MPRDRGQLRVFLGWAPGAGNARVLREAAREARALGRVVLEHAADGGALDLDAVLAGRPEVLALDRLAHSNAPGARHGKRWQDVEELLAAGIDVWTALDVQELESLTDIVAQLAGVGARETVPDRLLDDAAEVTFVDASPDDVLQRPPGMGGAVGPVDLLALRELALRRVADRAAHQVDAARQARAGRSPPPTRERLLVCVGPSPTSARVIRAARRMAAATHAEWIAVHVETRRLDPLDRERLTKHFALAEQLGAETVTLTGDAVADEVVRYARARNATRLVIGKTGAPRRGWLARRPVVERVVELSGDIDVYVIRGVDEPAAPERATPADGAARARPHGYLGAAAALAAATTAGWLFHLLGAPEATVVMTYLLGVIAVAGVFGRGPAVASSVGAVLLFNYFFTEPYYTVVVHDPGHGYTFAMMLVVAIAVSELTARIRARLELAREREQRFEAMYRVSQRLAGVAGAAPLARAAEELLSEIFPGEVVLLLPGPGGLWPVVAHELTAAPAELETARWVFEHGQPAGRGTDTLPHAAGVYVPLAVPGRRVGVLGWRPRDGRAQLDIEARRLLATFVNQVALALERDRLAEDAHLVQAQADAEKLRSSLLGGLSHDLRTPLAAISGSASALLQSDEQDAPTRRLFAQTIQVEADRLARFVEKVLQMTRIHAGRLEVDKQWHPLDEVIGSALHRLEQALGQREVALFVPGDAPLVPMDGLLVEQVLVNLLENAVSYSPADAPIEVGAQVADGAVEVWVADRGPGVAVEDRERVFEMFFRSPVAGQVRTQGVGLGLAICRAVVQAHDGAIRVEPREDGEGARFVFSLPLGDAPPALPEPASVPVGGGAPRE